MARDGGYCNCCGKHYIESGVDYRTGKDKELLSKHELDSIMYSAAQTMVKEFKDGYKKPLLIIELQDESSVPKVIYKGEELSYKQHIHFDWKTANKESLQSGLELLIKRVVDSKGSPFIKTIEVKSGDHFWSDVE